MSFGFYKLADNYHFPGWHQQSSVQDFAMNLDKWEALSSSHKAIIEAACAESLMRVYASYKAFREKYKLWSEIAYVD
ncbi:C4-dicarboxylate ABC transporter [Sulfitobacter geojensis]|nr:C4-dicarboxylate ABC transporter [Sulfitobacter geojensis]NYI29899.1 TRAP-type mannitol/chloroaromatic compound transport system substrate-binding protein [Sulfitobacter geojensis]